MKLALCQRLLGVDQGAGTLLCYLKQAHFGDKSYSDTVESAR